MQSCKKGDRCVIVMFLIDTDFIMLYNECYHD